MSLNLEETLKRLTDFLQTEAKTETVVGKTFQLGEFTCVPVIKFGLGLGAGGGEGTGGMDGKTKGEGTGGGAGGGIGIVPIGFLVSRGEQISFLPTEKTSGLSAAFEKVPSLMEKYFDSRKKEKRCVAR